MNRFRSIRVKVWLYFSGFSAGILMLLWILQVGFLPQYYEWMKTKEITRTAQIIKNSSENGNFLEVVQHLASSQNMNIEIAFESGISYKYDEMGAGKFELFSSKIPTYKRQILSSKNGIIYEQFYDQSVKLKVLLLGTYLASNSSSVGHSGINAENEQNNMQNTSNPSPFVPKVEAYIFIISYLEPVGTTAAILNNQFFLLIGIVMFIAFIISYFISSLIARPIVKINRSARELAKGNYDVMFTGDGYEEIKQLSDTLNYASLEISKSDKLQKELIANISHDLRTPLTMIKAYAEMVRDLSGDNPEKRNTHISVIIDEADRLASLVADILNLSTLRSKTNNLNLAVINFSDHLKELISRYNIFSEKNGYVFTATIMDGIYLNADIAKLEQVVYNLINNALTYTGEDKHIFINLYIKDDRIRFEVKDTGEGIPREKLDLIWDRYYKGGGTHKRAVMGTGLGLSIVKSILDMHGFGYGVESMIGEGSVFWFESDILILYNKS